MKKLTDQSLRALKTEGFTRDPECTGLYVQVSRKQKGGVTHSWVYRYKSPVTGKSRWMGLGSCECVKIADARDLARAARKLVTFGADPIDYRNSKKEQDRQIALKETASRMTFAACVDGFLKSGRLDKSKSDKHRAQFRASLALACAAFGDMNVAAIDNPTVIKFLTPIWNKTPETANRTRGRIEKVLDWARVHQFRDGANPAAWTGNLEHTFITTAEQKPLPALPHTELPAFMTWLRRRDTTAARALEFTILTAARAGEVQGATWSEIDLEARTWTVPAERMKANKEHVVPLSDRVIELLKSLPRTDGLVFIGPRKGAKLGPSVMLDTLREYSETATVHGFRSAFRDWAGDNTTFDNETIEHSLAHKLKDKVEAAYRRGTALDKRRLLMNAWAGHCNGAAQADNVVQLHA